MPNGFQRKEQGSDQEAKSIIKDEFDDLKELAEEKAEVTEQDLLGDFGSRESIPGLSQARLDNVLVSDKDLYVVTFDWSVTDRTDDVLTHFFTCHYPSEILSISEVHGVDTSAACTIGIYKTPSGGSIGSGTALLSSNFDLATGANTPVIKDVDALVAGTRYMARGDRLSIKLETGATAGLQFLTISVYLQYRERGEYRNA